MIIFGIFGVIVNFLAAYFTREGHSLNQKAVNLHMLEDVLGWVIVLIGAVIMKFTDISIIDSILSILVAIFIFINALKTFKTILNLFLEKTPSNIDIDKLKHHILELEGVFDVHHIHVWSIDGYNNYATMHVVVEDNMIKVKENIRKDLKEYGIGHVTLEIEENDEKCTEINCEINEKHIHNHHNHH